ncbi:Uncharacterised protein [Mycobacteroides abscessus subsp. abscessus]|nr:Uncharacterised protein [Mycobacteroides abscessus subsp. abscessus]
MKNPLTIPTPKCTITASADCIEPVKIADMNPMWPNSTTRPRNPRSPAKDGKRLAALLPVFIAGPELCSGAVPRRCQDGYCGARGPWRNGSPDTLERL